MPRPERAPIHVALACALALVAATATASAEPVTLRIATWGGSYEAAQRDIFFAPFEAATGINIETVRYDGGDAVLDDDPPDLVDMAKSQAIAACAAGRLRRLDHDTLPDGADGTPAVEDFVEGALGDCALTHTVYATVIAFDRRAFPGHPPTRIADVFNTEAFPGRRALRRRPEGNLEWALLASGVPTREVYDLLSTQRGLDLAFERLGRLREHIVWWRNGEEPVRLLEAGEVAMASGYNGRFFAAHNRGAQHIAILWDSQIREQQTWVVPTGARHPEVAEHFIRFATRSDPLTAFAERIAYGPARHSSARAVGTHPETDADMRVHIPTHPYNSRNALEKDVDWYAHTLQRIRNRFQDWLAR